MNHKINIENVTGNFNMLIKLPGEIKGILAPKLDYVISKLKGNDPDNHDDEMQVEDSLYIGTGDTDVMQDDNETIDEGKFSTLKQNYRDLDKMFLALRNADSNLYNSVLALNQQ